MNPIAIAVERSGAGQAGLARLLGVTPQAVNQWINGNRPVPPRHVLAIEAATGVSRHDLRPDVFGNASGDRPLTRIGPEIDSRMSKRALRARLGMSTDKQLAKVLQLPAEQVEGWAEEGALPALPQIQRLLGVQEQPQAQPAPHDPDEDRYAPLEVA
ncbi:Putative antitoxin of toxin-antitoxin system, YdaS/YdaT [Stenotrophomonas sp. yr243]|uniref:transcriptional regulator n=1 Tax=Stenotrophomonas lactitubi TaxID=2045214 RepID=UPI000B783C12|nr:Putative antitoxin of toxin-antitoxin system, YdaS/YdaT [Stenotrophomonas sp. yr243]